MRAFLSKFFGSKPKNSILAEALEEHTKRYFYSGQALSWMKPENKETLISELHSKLAEVQLAANPRMKLRELLADYIIQFAPLQLLSLDEEDRASHFFAANPYITTEINRNVAAAAEYVPEAAEYVWGQDGATAEEIVGFANARSALMLYYANGLNMLRIETGDHDPSKDWFLPFVEAMLVWEEHVLRSKLGLPDLLADPLDGLQYSLFTDYVLEGTPNPFFKWTRDHPGLYLAGHGPDPGPQAPPSHRYNAVLQDPEADELQEAEEFAAVDAGDEAGHEKEAKLAELTVMKARWAKNYAADMLNQELTPEDRAEWREKYQQAKTTYLIQANSIRDDFYRGRALHGVIDLLLAGQEVEHARSVFASIDGGLQESIIHTNPEAYAGLKT